jgi:hypothetical protein
MEMLADPTEEMKHEHIYISKSVQAIDLHEIKDYRNIG